MKLADQQTIEGILFTDQYQLTMAQLYYRMGIHEQYVQFDHFAIALQDSGPVDFHSATRVAHDVRQRIA